MCILSFKCSCTNLAADGVCGVTWELIIGEYVYRARQLLLKVGDDSVNCLIFTPDFDMSCNYCFGKIKPGFKTFDGVLGAASCLY